jgi:PAS domain S-box-containing protein
MAVDEGTPEGARAFGPDLDVHDLHPDGMVVADADASILYVNERACQILAMSAEKLIGTDIRTSFPLQDNEGRSW